MTPRPRSNLLAAWMCATIAGLLLAFQVSALAGGAAPAPCSPKPAQRHVTGSSELYHSRETATKLAREDALTKAQEACSKQTVPAECGDSWLHARIEYGAVTCTKGLLSGEQYRCSVEADYFCFCTTCKKP